MLNNKNNKKNKMSPQVLDFGMKHCDIIENSVPNNMIDKLLTTRLFLNILYFEQYSTWVDALCAGSRVYKLRIENYLCCNFCSNHSTRSQFCTIPDAAVCGILWPDRMIVFT